MRGSHLTKEGWQRADTQILRIVKSIENLKMDDNGDRYWTKSRDKKTDGGDWK
jgi:hypothetical protein